MKLEMYAIRDITQNQVMRPMSMVNDGDAIRQFTEVVNNNEGNNLVNRYPEQYELLHIGAFDTDTGRVTGTDPRSLGPATQFIR